MRNTLVILFAMSMVMIACGPSIYMTPDAYERSAKHQKIAILPPKVNLPPQRKVSPEALEAQSKIESSNFQSEIYQAFLRRKSKGQIFVDIQDVEETNVLLTRNFPEGVYTNAEVCKVLGVDAVVTSQFSLSKPMSEGAAIATMVLVGFAATTNEVKVNMSIKDCSDNTMFWNYDYQYSGSVNTTVSALVDGLMRNASRKIPYNSQSN
jgi:hypothetical protein